MFARDKTRRGFLWALTGLVMTGVAGCEPQRSYEDPDVKRNREQKEALRAAQTTVTQGRRMVVEALLKRPDVTSEVKDLLKKPEIGSLLENVAIVLGDVIGLPHDFDNRRAINLNSPTPYPKLHPLITSEVRTLIVALIQFGLKDGLPKLTAELSKKTGTDVRTPPNFEKMMIDGQWGRESSITLKNFQQIILRLCRAHHVHTSFAISDPPVVGRDTAGAMCQKIPAFGALLIPLWERFSNGALTHRTLDQIQEDLNRNKFASQCGGFHVPTSTTI